MRRRVDSWRVLPERLDVPDWIRSQYRQIQVSIDFAVLMGAVALAYLLRFDFDISQAVTYGLVAQAPFVVLAELAALFASGAYQRVWRFTSMQDLPLYVRAMGYSSTVIGLVRLAPLSSLDGLRIPLSIIVFNGVLALAGLLAVRVARRWVFETRAARKRRGGVVPAWVIFVGAGSAGVLAAREVDRRGDTGITPVAFVDDDPLKRGSLIAGRRVMGATEDLPRLVRELGADHAVLTISSLRGSQRDRIVSICHNAGIRLRTIPSYSEILQGTVRVTRLRDVQPEQLLGRESVEIRGDRLRAEMAGARVLISGAGGSIGSELARQAVEEGAARVFLLERSEHALFEIEREIRDEWPNADVEAILADVGDENAMRGVLQSRRPTVVLHAAAHKHVAMLEYHAAEAIKNNVLATSRFGSLAGEFGVSRFVLVSTDKAVKPSSVMGASKRLAELVIQQLNARSETRYSAVRFGNVLGSTGSVIPIFRQQIESGGPVTVTDPDMERYFMSLREAAQLVLRAGHMAEGGEIFVLDMGSPVRITDLAENMIRLSGYEPGQDIRIVITGRRPGEKLSEELSTQHEGLARTAHPKILVGSLQPLDTELLDRALAQLALLAATEDNSGIRTLLAELLPDAQLEEAVDPSRPPIAR